jgi:hypothetical protein
MIFRIAVRSRHLVLRAILLLYKTLESPQTALAPTASFHVREERARAAMASVILVYQFGEIQKSSSDVYS